MKKPSFSLGKIHFFEIQGVEVESKNRSKINQKSINKSSQQHNNQKLKNIKKTIGFLMFLATSAMYVVVKNQYEWCQHPSKNSSQINTPTCIDFGANLVPFWDGFGSHDGAKLAPNRSKNQC